MTRALSSDFITPLITAIAFGVKKIWHIEKARYHQDCHHDPMLMLTALTTGVLHLLLSFINND